MLNEMTPEQFSMWRAFFALEPFGEKRMDYRIGTLAAITANSNRDPKRRPQPFKPEDFFPSLKDSSKKRASARKPMMAEDWQLARKMFTVNYGG